MGALVDRRVAFALPWVVIVTCLMLPVALAYEVVFMPPPSTGVPLSTWVGVVPGTAAMILVLAWAHRARGLASGVLVGMGSVALGFGTIAGTSWLLQRSDGGAFAGIAVVFLIPGAAILLALAAVALSWRATASDRRKIALAWVLALVAPFALGPLVGWLSDKAGNAQMDLIALFILPFVAVVIWWAGVLLGAVVRRIPARTSSE